MIEIIFEWDGEVMRPIARHRRLASQQYILGQRYIMTAIERRSWASHNHYFAALHDAWLNLPEDQAERFPTPEHLRKYALIKCGYADERSIVCSSSAEALRVAAFVRPMNDYALVTIAGRVVRLFTAKSQSMRAMGRKEFQASKKAVLDYVASLIGSDRATLLKQVETNAQSMPPEVLV